ncbi:MAG: YdgH/BhsA/McbA-like domain containing protein, partial [Mixta calida]|nr:YdgH/BhsA/McbA-like domain containing protein [Mixta calida]
GKAALAAGGVAAKQVELPGVASSETPSNKVGRFFETQTSTGERYTVRLPNGTEIQEVNAITAAQMQPFDTVTFTGHFGTPTEISEAVAKRAAAKGAKFYHVTRQWQNQSGGNLTVTADLFK